MPLSQHCKYCNNGTLSTVPLHPSSHHFIPICRLPHPYPHEHAPLLLIVRAQARQPGLPPHDRKYFQLMMTWTTQLTYILTALPRPHNRLHALHHLLQTIGSNKQHYDPPLDTHPGVPFARVQHAWRFERRPSSPCRSQRISRSAHLCQWSWTACLSQH